MEVDLREGSRLFPEARCARERVVCPTRAHPGKLAGMSLGQKSHQEPLSPV